MLAHSDIHYTVEEYLVLERDSEERHIYFDGSIFDMAGESPAHGTICTNLTRIVSTQLLRTPCQAFSKDTKVGSGQRKSTSRRGLLSYPDLVVVCGQMQFHDQHQDILINPAVIIEVLSKTTEAFDRGARFQRLQAWNPTLTDYLLVSQTSPIVEHFVRQQDGGWLYHVYEGLDRSVLVKSINCTLPLGEVYDRIDLPEESDR